MDQQGIGSDAEPRPRRAAGTDPSRGRRAAWLHALGPEARFALRFALLIFAMSMGLWRLGDASRLHQHLGAEYCNIGRALAEGRGFSDPFGERTGPTAWMPPLLPALMGLLFFAFKSRPLVGGAVLFLADLALIGIGTTLYGISRRCALRLNPLLAVALYVVWIGLFHYWFFAITHDVCFVALIVCFLVIGAYLESTGAPVNPWLWGSLGGACALLSPAAAFAWVCLSIRFFVQAHEKRAWLRAAAVAAVVVMPWTVRNAVVFRQFIPVKSNLFFDAYQGTFVDDDGVYDARTMMLHPFSALGLRFQYARLGEAKYSAMYRSMFLKSLAQDPNRYLRSVANRLSASTLAYRPVNSDSEPPVEVRVKRVVYPLPLLVFLVAMCVRGRHRRLLVSLGVLWSAFVLPYVLVAFYVRYLLGLTPVLILALFLGLDDLVERLSGRRTSPRRTASSPGAPAL